MPPSLGAALGLGLRAAAREGWLVPVGAAISAARRAALWPAWALVWTIAVRAALLAWREHPLDPGAPLEGALAALGSPRLLGLAGGLWLCGILLGAALRVAWLSGALPTLGGAMAGAPGPRFAAGVAFGFPRVLGTAALALAADVAAGLFAATLALGAVLVTARAAGQGGGFFLAVAVALALTLAVAVPLALAALGDAAVARAAVRAEDPGAAFAASVRRLLARPGTFVLAAIAFAVAATMAAASIEALRSTATSFVPAAAPLLLAGPQLVVSAVALLAGAALDLWRLGTFAALGCGGEGP